MLEQYQKYDHSSSICQIAITDQSESGLGEVFDPLVLNLQFEGIISTYRVDPALPNHASVHHGTSINFLISEVDFPTTHVILSDSDCFPVSGSWLEKVLELLNTYDAICSLEENSDFITHPCFMVLPTRYIRELNFLKHTKDHWVDTGRLIGLQLFDLGCKVCFVKPERIFRGKKSKSRGFFDGSIIHVGNASFRSLKIANDPSYGSFTDSKFAVSRFIVEHMKWLFNTSKLNRNICFYSIWLFFFARGIFSNISVRLRSTVK